MLIEPEACRALPEQCAARACALAAFKLGESRLSMTMIPAIPQLPLSAIGLD